MATTFKIIDRLPHRARQIVDGFETAMTKSAMDVHRLLIREILVGGGRGKVYRVPATKRTYRASAAGDPPASRTGHLRSSYRFVVRGTGAKAEGVIGSPTQYAKYLEDGTKHIKPRPHLSRAMELGKPLVRENFKRYIK